MGFEAWRNDISIDGIQRMIAVINSKLLEMTGVEDKTLANYVVFLVQTGMTGEEIKTILNNFLRDQSGPFVSWLFGHLVSHMDHYTSPEPNIQSAEQRNISFQARSKKYQTQSSLNAKSSGGSLFGSAKYIHRNSNNIYGGVENNNTEIARKSIFERLGNFHEGNKNHDGDGGVENNNTEIARKSIFDRLGNFQERNNNHDDVADKNRKRTRLDSPPFQFGNNRIISHTDIPTSKKRRLEYKQELPATPFVPPVEYKQELTATPFVPALKYKQELPATPFVPPRSTPVAPPCPTKSIRRPASTRKVFGTPRNTMSKAKRTPVFDRLGKKIDSQTKGSNGVAANEGTHTPQNLEARSVAVSNVYYEATSSALIKHFMPCGKVTSVQMLYNISTGGPTGTAIVEFDSKEEANRALSMNGSTFMSRKLQVAPKSLSQVTTGREHIQSSGNFQCIRDPSTTDSLANSRIPSPFSNIANSRIPVAPISNIANSRIPSPFSNIANTRIPAPISNIASSRIPAPINNIANSRIPAPISNIPSSIRPAPSSSIANSTRVPLAQTPTGPRNFQWGRDASTPDNLTISRNPAASSNIANSRRQPTFQSNTPQKPNPARKF